MQQNSFNYKCGICKDSYWIISFEGKATRCKCFKEVISKEQWEMSGLKADDKDKTFNNFQLWSEATKGMKTVASNYCIRFKNIKSDRVNSIMLCGNPGSGKTHLAIAIANNLIKQGYKVMYMSYRDELTRLKQSIIDKEQYQKMMKKYQEAEVLLIDDLFKGKITESDLNIMFEIINYRYINKMPIICSSEFLINKMLEFDEAVGSRLFEMAREYVYEVVGRENNYRIRR